LTWEPCFKHLESQRHLISFVQVNSANKIHKILIFLDRVLRYPHRACQLKLL
jgi:hypothetical protein